MMTFGQLNEQIAIYTGTDVDQATQAALLEWLFDSYLSTPDDSPASIDKWIRQYLRYVNMNYPIYLDLLKMDLVRSTMDPFVTELIERIIEGTGETTEAGSTSKNGTTGKTTVTDKDVDVNKGTSFSGNTSEHTVTDNAEVRTPNLEIADQGSTTVSETVSGTERDITDNTELRTPNLSTSETNGNTRTDNTQAATTSTDTGTINTDTDISTEDGTQARAMQIAYPEANMNAIPVDINNFPTNIDYAEGEADNFGHGTHTEDNQSQETRNLASSSTTNNTGTVTDAGSKSATQTGTEQTDFDGDVSKTTNGTNNGTGSETNIRTETGTERTDFDGDISKSITRQDTGSEDITTAEDETKTEQGTTSETGTSSNTVSSEDNKQENVEGRHESIADILPRACKAIKSTNALKWFVQVLQPCFDNYCEL